MNAVPINELFVTRECNNTSFEKAVVLKLGKIKFENYSVVILVDQVLKAQITC